MRAHANHCRLFSAQMEGRWEKGFLCGVVRQCASDATGPRGPDVTTALMFNARGLLSYILMVVVPNRVHHIKHLADDDGACGCGVRVASIE